MGNEKGQRRAAQSEIDQVARQAIGHALDRRAGALGPLNGLDNASEGSVAAELFRADFQHARLVDGAREYWRAGDLSPPAWTRP